MITLQNTFSHLQENNDKALIASVIAGDPSPDICVEIAVALAQSGADILELGIPFADATVGGAVIQDATKRALQQQIDMATVFSIVKQIRKQTDTPIILSAYYNPIFAFGEQKFCDQAIQSGACGVVVLDLPFGERSSLYQYAATTFPKIELFTTTTSEKRLEKIATAAAGFLIFMPQTGANNSCDDDITSIEKKIVTALLSAQVLPPILQKTWDRKILPCGWEQGQQRSNWQYADSTRQSGYQNCDPTARYSVTQNSVNMTIEISHITAVADN